MTSLINAKLKTGEAVVIRHEDYGIVDAVDANGQPYKAYRDHVEVAGRYGDSDVDVELVNLAKDPASFRLAECIAYLDALGVDHTTIDYGSLRDE